MRHLVLAAALLASAPLEAVRAQSAPQGMPDSPAALRCSALSELDSSAIEGALAYLAGYNDGQRAATAVPTVGASAPPAIDAAAAPGAAEAPEAGASAGDAPVIRTGGPSAAAIPDVPVEAILSACANSPDSRVIDMLTASGVAWGR